ncbi:MAG: STAS domain-containing protein, partial [Acidimicrobiales bacterium]
VDSAGLGALIGGIRRARELGGDVAVACNRPTLVRLLRTTGFDRIVTVAETIEEAKASLEQPEEASE